MSLLLHCGRYKFQFTDEKTRPLAVKIGAITGSRLKNRLASSLSAVLVAALNGENILRIHDVTETVYALAVSNAVTKQTK